MRTLWKGRGEPLLAALVITMVVLGLIALIPAVSRRLSERSAPTATPTPSVSAPAQALFLFEEEQKALQAVATIANEQGWGTAFLVDGQGDFLTASTLVSGRGGLRLIDNTGGTHQVRVLGTDEALGIAMVRAATDATPLAIGDSSTVAKNDPLVLLASPKVEALASATAAQVAQIQAQAWTLRLVDHPENVGGPLLGPGARVLAVLTEPTAALPINLAQPELGSWRTRPGTLVPLAPFPDSLILRGSDVTSTPPASASLVAVSPTRASRSQEMPITLQGTGFVNGPALSVRFMPSAGGSGGFTAQAPAVAGPTTITAKIPPGAAVADYVIELINGDGTVVDSRVAFTITP